MHLDADDLDVAHFRGALVNCRRLAEGDPKFILVRSGGDVFVGVRIDVRIDAQANRRAQLFRTCDFVDVFELGLALDIETVNALLEPVLNFFSRFADARKRAFFRIGARFDRAKKFAAGNDVEPGAFLGEQFQDRAI